MPGLFLRNNQERIRLQIKMPLTKPEIAIEIIAITGIVAMLILVLTSWSSLPESVPTHFNFAGEVDSWGSKNSILMFPLISIIIYILLTVFSRFPHLINYPVRITEENARQEYTLARIYMSITKLIIIWMFYFIYAWVRTASLGIQTDIKGVMWSFLAGIFIVTVGYFYLAIKFAKRRHN